MLKYNTYGKIMMCYMPYQPNNFVFIFIHTKDFRMKNLKLQLSIIFFLLFVNLTKADHFINLKIIASNNQLMRFIRWKPKFNNLRKIVKSCLIWEKRQ